MKSQIFLLLSVFFLSGPFVSASETSFSLDNFESCTEMQQSLKGILSQYSDQYGGGYPPYRLMDAGNIAPSSVGSVENKSLSVVPPATSPFSTTNTQVA